MNNKPKYRKHVLVCTSEKPEHCGQKGGLEVLAKLREEVKAHKIDDIKVSKAGCVDEHARGPIVMVYPDGVWYCEVKPDDAKEIVEGHLVDGRVVERLFLCRVG